MNPETAPTPPALTPEQLAARAQQNPRLLQQVINGLHSGQARERFGSAKTLRSIAQSRPEVLYPFFDVFAGLLDHPNKILQWEGTIVLSHLARVDADAKFTPIFRKYFAPISGPVMISAANVIGGGARIALARPDLADRIAAELLNVKSARYATPECRNVAIGHALAAFGEFFHLLHRQRAPVLEFARRQLKNSRPATRKKAERLVKKIGDASL